MVIDKATGELVECTTYLAYGATESDYRPERWQSQREDYRFTGGDRSPAGFPMDSSPGGAGPSSPIGSPGRVSIQHNAVWELSAGGSWAQPRIQQMEFHTDLVLTPIEIMFDWWSAKVLGGPSGDDGHGMGSKGNEGNEGCRGIKGCSPDCEGVEPGDVRSGDQARSGS